MVQLNKIIVITFHYRTESRRREGNTEGAVRKEGRGRRKGEGRRHGRVGEGKEGMGAKKNNQG